MPRVASCCVKRSLRGYFRLEMLLAKPGRVAANPANYHRFLADECGLVVVFSVGRRQAKRSFSNRYRLGRLGRGGWVSSAISAHAEPTATMCVARAQQSAPTFARSALLSQLTRLLYFPLTPRFPRFGRSAMPSHLPAKFNSRFVEPVRVEQSCGGFGRGVVCGISQRLRRRMQQSLFEAVDTRQSVRFG